MITMVVLTAPRMWPVREGADEALRAAVEAVRASGAEPILYDRPAVQVSYEDRPKPLSPAASDARHDSRTRDCCATGG